MPTMTLKVISNHVWNSESSKEFELTWQTIINDFKLEENGWLSWMYNI